MNSINESVFYCAESLNTAGLETRPDRGQYLTLLECAIRSSLARAGSSSSGALTSCCVIDSDFASLGH